MITGEVRVNQPCVRLRVRGLRGRQQTIAGIIDTGFTAWLTLPRRIVSALELPWWNTERGFLADGSESVFDTYQAIVLWDRRLRRILVAEFETTPLVGMALLNGYRLNMAVCPHGRIAISPLSGS